jgi:hypothetical protein
MKIVAKRIPGSANTTFIPSASVSGVSQPVLPNKRINMKPAITGDTAKGISTSPLRMRLPQKLSRTNTHAMQRPNSVLMTVAPTAIIKVSLSEFIASGEVIAVANAPKPSPSAPQPIAIKGATSKPAAYSTTTEISAHSTSLPRKKLRALLSDGFPPPTRSDRGEGFFRIESESSATLR